MAKSYSRRRPEEIRARDARWQRGKMTPQDLSNGTSPISSTAAIKPEKIRTGAMIILSDEEKRLGKFVKSAEKYGAALDKSIENSKRLRFDVIASIEDMVERNSNYIHARKLPKDIEKTYVGHIKSLSAKVSKLNKIIKATEQQAFAAHVISKKKIFENANNTVASGANLIVVSGTKNKRKIKEK